jgi:HAD superfamily 5'-nucleotidase-like hydrolase
MEIKQNARSETYAHDSAPTILHLLERAKSGVDPAFERRVFVNRTLRMEMIDVICFDLDWTLAAYERELLQRLIFDTSLERLVSAYGYPDAIRSAAFRPNFAHRGLMIDKAAGTVVKMDRHFYVGRAYLGRRRLTSGERMDLYRRSRVDMGRRRFYHVDTLFELAEVNLFSEIVDLIDRRIVPGGPPFDRLFDDIRHAVDGVHADRTLKSKIISGLPALLPKDPELPLTLKKLALTGRKLLLISNSEWYYTDAICRYLFDDVAPSRDWRRLFDLIIVGARKPLFFRDESPFTAIDEEGHPAGVAEVPQWGGRYLGGSREKLQKLLDVPGERVLYVGDHIYSDILATKLRSTWRTMLVVSELEDELKIQRRMAEDIDRLTNLRNVLADLGRRLDSARDVVTLHGILGDEGMRLAKGSVRETETVQELADGHEVLRRRAAVLDEKITNEFNPYWGSVFKQGSSQSLFGSQVDAFACVYTSRVSNLLPYGNSHYFRVLADPMIHESQKS